MPPTSGAKVLIRGWVRSAGTCVQVAPELGGPNEPPRAALCACGVSNLEPRNDEPYGAGLS